MNKNQIEIERKYIIKKPACSSLAAMPEYTERDITQIYLDSPLGTTHRVRSEKYEGKTVYTETKKIRIDKMSVNEIETEISESRFVELCQCIKLGTRPINKTRRSFVYNGQVFEIDIYGEWEHTCIMETELPSRDTVVEMPDFIEIVKEVTGIYGYSNAAMAENFPEETI